MLCFRAFLRFITLHTLCICVTIGANKKSVLKNVEEDVKKLKANKVKCTRGDFSTMFQLKCEGKLEKALLCVGEKLLANEGPEYGKFWTLLGEIYHAQGKLSKGNKCFKEAGKMNGKFTGQIELWHFLGPFQIGKPELDGDPLETFGGIERILCGKYNRNFVAYSEMVPGVEVKWSTIKPDRRNIVEVAPMINWQELVHGLFSQAVVGWQGWLVGDFVLNSEMTVLLQCLGVSTIYIDGNILVGDLYRRKDYWHPIHLKPGMHSVLLRARAAGELIFACNLKPADQAPSFQLHNPFMPDLVDGKIFSDLFAIPVTNYNPTKWLTITKLTLISQDTGPDITLHLTKGQIMNIAPGQIHSIIGTFKFREDKRKQERCTDDIKGKLQLKSSNGYKEEILFTIRCRKKAQSFVFTFMDHDGSVQSAAAIFPIVKEQIAQTCPVLLTLHGTSSSTDSPSQNQADSYKRMVNGKWVFGVEGLWTLAPTRHGAHNWEGPGELTAITALQKLAELTLQHDWIIAKANRKAVVFAGHSMGGHGAWQLSTHHPDIALAVVSLAGWLSKERYGEENSFFKHDISVSHAHPSVKHVMESCVTENDAEKHVSNLKGIPVMIRVGAEDKTVLPYFGRRMYRLLKEQGNNVTYSEVPGKEHWWWDTYTTNDGGTNNDPDVRKFLVKHSKFAVKRTTNVACSKTEEGVSCEEASSSKYSLAQTLNRNLAGSGEFLLTVFNPASSYGVRGIQVIQQATPFRKSTVRIQFTESSVVIVSSNVVRLRFTEPPISPVHWHERRIIIDGVEVEVDGNKGNVFDLCLDKPESWNICGDTNIESETQRGPVNLGPARRIAESPLLIIVGTSSKSETNQAFLQMAVYIGNLFFLTSDSIVPILRDKDVADKDVSHHNLIILGEISFATPYLEKVPLSFGEDKSISLGGCLFRSPEMGVLSLVPHAGSRLALIITGTSLSSIRNVVHIATPTIPPMARSPFSNLVPDYVITGPEFRAQGPGGYLCAGFWGNRWEYRSDISSCAC